MPKQWIDHKGREIPADRVRPHEKDREKLVRKLFKKAERLHNELKALKEEVAEEVDGHLDNFAKAYDTDGWKGNALLHSFDRTQSVERRVVDKLDFGEELQLAQQKAQECIKKWSKGANKNLKILVDRAFQTDAKGRLNRNRILELQRAEIDDPDWDKVRELIGQAIRVVDQRVYYRFYYTDNRGQRRFMTLDFGDLEIPEKESTKEAS